MALVYRIICRWVVGFRGTIHSMKQSAGILVYRQVGDGYEVMLAHPGGPFWAKKDSWSVPKGELEPDEDLLTGARREFTEEIGTPAPDGELLSLGEAKYSGKTNHIWAVEGEVDLSHFSEVRPSNMVELEWPPRSGKQISFAENDRAEWFNLSTAHTKIFKNQQVFIERLAEKLGVDLSELPLEPETPDQQSLL
jgi:predicted NUDIX family NTP pyrophosphohydrolase